MAWPLPSAGESGIRKGSAPKPCDVNGAMPAFTASGLRLAFAVFCRCWQLAANRGRCCTVGSMRCGSVTGWLEATRLRLGGPGMLGPGHQAVVAIQRTLAGVAQEVGRQAKGWQNHEPRSIENRGLRSSCLQPSNSSCWETQNLVTEHEWQTESKTVCMDLKPWQEQRARTARLERRSGIYRLSKSDCFGATRSTSGAG